MCSSFLQQSITEKKHLVSAFLHPNFAMAASEYKIPVNSHYQVVFHPRGNALSFENRAVSIGNVAFSKQKKDMLPWMCYTLSG